jgi:hypothetical protein
VLLYIHQYFLNIALMPTQVFCHSINTLVVFLLSPQKGVLDGTNYICLRVTSYKDGLQPETLADGNWLVKQNQPVSKIETESDTNLRSLYES